MSPKAVWVCSDWSFSDTQCDWERPIEHDWVWLGLTSVGVIGGHNEVG